MAPREFKHPRFLADLDELWLFIAADNANAADRLLDRIGRVLSMLLNHPEAGRQRPELGEDVRSFPIANYIVFYRPGQQRVDFIRALHGARDVQPDDLPE